MSPPGQVRVSHKVDLVEEADLAIRVFRRGPPRPDRLCDLTVAVNGHERLHQTEQAGPEAPGVAVVDLRLDGHLGALLVRALPARPWLVHEMPVIAYAVSTGGDPMDDEVRYLVRTPVVEQVLATFRSALDLEVPVDLSDAIAVDAEHWTADRAIGWA